MNAATKIEKSEYALLPEVLTTDEVCRLLSLSNHTVYALAKEGKLPGRRVAGRPFRFHRDGILKLLGVDVADLEFGSEHPDVLGMRELAALFRFHQNTLYKLHADKLLPFPDDAIIIKSPVRFAKHNVLQWLCSKCAERPTLRII